MDDEHEYFVYLTFFKVCKMYQDIKKIRRRNNESLKRKEKQPFALHSTKKTIEKSPVLRRHFSMFAKNTPINAQAKHKYSTQLQKHVKDEAKTPDACNDYVIPSQEIPVLIDTKTDISISGWQDAIEFSPDVTFDPGQTLEENGQNADAHEYIIDQQITDNNGQERSASETDQLPDHTNSQLNQLANILNDQFQPITNAEVERQLITTASGSEQKIKKRRRRRRPGDPPLSPLPKPKKEHIRKYRVHPENRDREKTGYFNTVFRDVKANDEPRFIQLFRITPKTYDLLLNEILATLARGKVTILPRERLTITLLYLAHGMHFNILKEKFKLGRSSIRHFVLQTCEAIWDVLSPIYVRDPTSEDYLKIANEFDKQWNLPNCAGVLGTRRVPFKANQNVKSAGKTYKFNEVKDVTVVASCDAKYLFRQMGITVELNQSPFYKSLISNTLPLPPGRPLDDDITDFDFPYYFVGSEEFPQTSNLMRPYNRANTTAPRYNIYNNIISSGQIVNKTAFSILTTMWRVLLSNPSFSFDVFCTVVKACIVLHNFVLVHEKHRWYESDGCIKTTWKDNIAEEEPSEWINEKCPLELLSHLESVEALDEQVSKSGLDIREALTDYFCIEKMSN